MPGFPSWRRNSRNEPTNTLDIPDDNGNISTTEYARWCRELMKLQRDLRSLGAGTTINIGLPCIAVIGGQSAGKSSLVEAISGINVPRDSGTCTRCPIECSLSDDAVSWTCKISLRIDYGSDSLLNGSQSFGPVLTDKRRFEIFLRRAQAAILSPHLPPATFLDKTKQELKTMLEDSNTLKFSKNTVVVDIADPEATNLSFVDLPGLIQNETQSVIDTVRSLVEDHIGRQETLILITIPMSDDMENQQAVRLAKDADPNGERTIGVLTKPDTITAGATSARQTWKQVLEGQLHPLKHGYYCVRLPDDVQRSAGHTRAAIQQLASDFFSSTSPWNEIADRRRLGIPGLVSDLSKILVGLIEQSLPKLKEAVEQLLAECDDELKKLPAPIANDTYTEILGHVTRFCTAFQGAVYGRNEERSLVQVNREHYYTFEMEIRHTEPHFIPSTDPGSSGLSSASTTSSADPLDLNEVRKVIKSSITWHLPHHVPFEAKRILIVRFVELWHVPSLSCFDAVFSCLLDFIDRLICTHFGRFKQLERYIRQLVHSEINSCKLRSLEGLDEALKRETMPLFAGGDEDYTNAYAKWLDHYKLQRRLPPSSTRQPSYSAGPSYYSTSRELSPTEIALRALAAIGLTYHDLSQLMPRDEFEDELIVMAEVRGYFDVAHRRIIHAIPMTIEQFLNQPLADRLQDSLVSNIFAESNVTERMEYLLSEEPEIASKRESLQSRKDQLLKIQERLQDFGP